MNWNKNTVSMCVRMRFAYVQYKYIWRFICMLAFFCGNRQSGRLYVAICYLIPCTHFNNCWLIAKNTLSRSRRVRLLGPEQIESDRATIW